MKKELGQQFIDWLISDEGQKAIADYRVNGEQLFWPQREYVMIAQIDARAAEGKAVISLTYRCTNARIAQDVA